jgi:hypothetical protein
MESSEPLVMSPLLAVCTIELDTPLRSKSNYRRSTKGSARSSEWRRYQEFESSLATLARLARPQAWPMGDPDEALSNRPGVVMLIAASSLLDTANMAKSVADALEGVLYHNDASIRHVACVSLARRASDQGGCVLVGLVEPTASLTDVLTAGTLLSAALTQRRG